MEVKYTDLFIGGNFVSPLSGRKFETINPATEEVITEVAEAGPQDIDYAVQSARRALVEDWGGMSAQDRGKILQRMGGLILECADDLARLETIDMGKPIRDSRKVDIPAAAERFRHFGERAPHVLKEQEIPVFGKFRARIRREPIGVIGSIIPWNYSTILGANKVAPALAAGNAVVLKPSELSPLSALYLGHIAREAGLPPGALNVVTGFGNMAGDALVSHLGVGYISFTGSVRTGFGIKRRLADRTTKLSLEMGGKSAVVVCEDADLDAAARDVSNSIYKNAGQTCTALSRCLVQRSVSEPFVEKLVQKARGIKVGDPMEEDTQMGPVVSESQLHRILSYIVSGVQEGAEVITGGNRIDRRGYFIEPTIMIGNNYMKVSQEEIFGPVILVIEYDDLEEAVELANGTRYGLAGGYWTKDPATAEFLSSGLDAGTIWTDGTSNFFHPAVPYGGRKDSGYGPPELGDEGLLAYTGLKMIWGSRPAE